MTIAQHKIKQYCIDNNISYRKLSVKLGYSDNYIHYILHGRIPDPSELPVIENYFNIITERDLAKDIILKRYGCISVGKEFFTIETRSNICYTSFWRWCNGILPRKKAHIRLFCDFLSLKNEWIDDYSTV